MPTLHRTPNYRIEIRSGDHLPPHVHVLFRDGREAFIEVESLAIRSMEISERELAEQLVWIQANQHTLLTEWKKWNPAK